LEKRMQIYDNKIEAGINRCVSCIIALLPLTGRRILSREQVEREDGTAVVDVQKHIISLEARNKHLTEELSAATFGEEDAKAKLEQLITHHLREIDVIKQDNKLKIEAQQERLVAAGKKIVE
jgi:hypothetical protein